jgi:hypothetical protein
MINQQIVRRLEALEESMGAGDVPPPDIELVFVEPVEGCPGGRIKRVVRLSELTKAVSKEG